MKETINLFTLEGFYLSLFFISFLFQFLVLFFWDAIKTDYYDSIKILEKRAIEKIELKEKMKASSGSITAIDPKLRGGEITIKDE